MRPVGRGLLIVALLACLVSLPTRADADIITITPNADGSFGGTFSADNDVALIYLSLLGPAFVTFNITSHLELIEPGFDPILTFFTAGGTQFTPPDSGDSYDPLFASFDGSFASNHEDLALFFPDVFSGGTMAAGNYLLAVTQYENSFNLSSVEGEVGGFQYDADSRFTCGPLETRDPECTGFLAFDGTSRSQEFAGSLTIEPEDVPQPVPEPGSLTLLALGSAALLARRARVRRRTPSSIHDN
jgi:PEP-CTERM motif